jgi:hypothetical protein
MHRVSRKNMSLNPQILLKPRETIENYEADFTSVLHNMDTSEIFEKVIKMDVQKRILLNAIFSKDPVNLIFVGPAGNGKTLLLECIRDAFPLISNMSDSHTSSGIGVIESIILQGKMLRFLIVDELEKFKSNDRQVFLSLIERGTISRKLANRKVELSGSKVWFLATSNDIEKMRRDQPELVNRCSVINVPALTFDDYLYVCSKRLLREKGIENEDIGKFIASRVYHDFGATDIRLAVRLARFAYGHAVRTRQYKITKDIIDAVATDFKLVETKV